MRYNKKNIADSGLIVYWTSTGLHSYLFSMSFLDNFFVKDKNIDTDNSNFSFSYTVEEPPAKKFIGRLFIDPVDYSLNIDLTSPITFNQKLVPSIPPEPHKPFTNNSLEMNLEDLDYKNLFPYIYIQPRPNISRDEFTNNFSECCTEFTPDIADATTSCTDTEDDFYNTLVKLKSEGNRLQMEIESVYFINGYNKNFEPVYPEQYQANLSAIGFFFEQIHSLGLELRSKEIITFEELTKEIIKRFESWDNLYKELNDPINKDEYIKIVMSYIALIISFGYNFNWMEQLQIIINIVNLFYKALPYTTPDKNSDEDNPKKEPNPETIHSWIFSTVLLPEDIFPLPPIYKNNPDTPTIKEWVVPYSLGRLRIVKYMLWKYSLGEVSKIESILKGEIKTVQERELNKSVCEFDSSIEDNFTWEETIKDCFAGNTNAKSNTLLKRVSATAYNSGVDGSIGGWTVTDDPAGGNQKDSNSFAREVINNAAEIINSKIKVSRSQKQINEHEESITHQFTNSAGQSDIIGIYRWINKIYKFKTIETGNKLIIEIFCANPAKYYIKNESQHNSIELHKVLSPASFGVLSYKNISTIPLSPPTETIENDTSQTNKPEGKNVYYLDILEYYEIKSFPPPPEPAYYTEINIAGMLTQEISYLIIPVSYKPTNSNLNITLTEKVSQVNVKIGNQEKTFISSGQVECALTAADMNGDQLTILISCNLKEKESLKNSNANSQATETAANLYSACIKITSALKENLLNEWKYNIYLLVKEGYKEKVNKYYEKANHRKNALTLGNEELIRTIIPRQLKSKSISVLKNHYTRIIKGKIISEVSPDNPDIQNLEIGEPAYLQFINNSIEWDKLTYYLYPEYENADLYSDQTTEANFYAFLQSKFAKILVPVKNEFQFSFLLFLSTGILWPGKDPNSPAIINDVNYYYQIKKFPRIIDEPVKESWLIKVPTSFTMLQHSPELPEFSEDKDE
jgi:hypothetical protein